jgi:hypothetical protein
MSEHGMALTTHTTELHQLDEMNTALAIGRRRLTAGALGLHRGVAGDAVLRRLRPAGPPSYPYVYGVFSREGRANRDGTTAFVELHTAELRAISDQLNLRRHVWGV